MKVIKIVLAVALVTVSVCVTAQGQGAAKKKVMDSIDRVADAAALLPAGAAAGPHVLFVNVGGALPDAEFRQAAAYVRMKYAVRVAVRDDPGPPFAADALARPAAVTNRFGAAAAVVVALVRDPAAPGYAAVPGWFAQVNVAGMDRGAPDALMRYKRACQFALRGLAYACGVGTNPDDMCVMAFRGFTPEGMDAVSATYGPYAYLPLRETLRAMAGDAIFAAD